MPAQIVAGSITISAISVEVTLNRMNPPVLRDTAESSHAIRSNETL